MNSQKHFYWVSVEGFTYKSGANVTTDDCMTLWAEFEATDHPNSTHNASFSISVGARVGTVIEVEMQTVTINRVAGEYADIAVNMTVLNGTNTTVFSNKSEANKTK